MMKDIFEGDVVDRTIAWGLRNIDQIMSAALIFKSTTITPPAPPPYFFIAGCLDTEAATLEKKGCSSGAAKNYGENSHGAW